MKKLLVLAFLSIVMMGCKNSIFPTKEEGIMKNLTNLDGCGWLIELNNDGDSFERLEPTNLRDFDYAPIDGQKVKIKYREVKSASICMSGTSVELSQIKTED